MKLRTQLLIVLGTAALCHVVFGQQPTPSSFQTWAASERLRLLEQQLIYERLQRQLQLQSIYSAYPDNPVLYRYLERNPRYIPLYLGK
jgi:hypothetical protein